MKFYTRLFVHICFILLIQLSFNHNSITVEALLIKACTPQQFQKIKSDICALVRRNEALNPSHDSDFDISKELLKKSK